MNSNQTTRKFLVVNQKGEHEYNIIVTQENQYGKKYELMSSDNQMWNKPYRNKLLLAMNDTGNGMKFDREIHNVGYDMAMYVRILLEFDNKAFSSIESRFKIIEEDTIIEI